MPDVYKIVVDKIMPFSEQLVRYLASKYFFNFKFSILKTTVFIIKQYIDFFVLHRKKVFCGVHGRDGNIFMSACQVRHIYNIQCCWIRTCIVTQGIYIVHLDHPAASIDADEFELSCHCHSHSPPTTIEFCIKYKSARIQTVFLSDYLFVLLSIYLSECCFCLPCNQAIVAIGYGLSKKCWLLVLGCVLRTAGSIFVHLSVYLSPYLSIVSLHILM